MAKPEIRPSKSKMAVIILEGSDQTIQDGIKTISQALTNAFRAAPIPMRAPVGALKDASREESVEAEEPIIVDELDISGGNEQPPISVSAPRNRKFRSPKVLELGINAESLRQFMEARKLGPTDAKRYLAAMVFLKQDLKIEELSMDHIHTCYRLMGWVTPKNASMPLRNLKNAGSVHKCEGEGIYKLSHVGEDIVLQLPKS